MYVTQPDGLHIDVEAMTGAQLKKLLAYKNPSGWVLTPSASLRYTVEGGAVTEITLNGAPVTDTQVIKIAANYILMAGGMASRDGREPASPTAGRTTGERWRPTS